MIMRGAKIICGVALAAAFLSLSLAHGDDDSDPTPVVIKPKRPSITARTLPHLIELAEQHSPNIQAAKNTYDIAELNYETARTAWLPTLDLTAIHGYLGATPNVPGNPMTPIKSELDLVANDNVFDSGQSITKWEQAKTVLERSKVEYEIARDQQLLNVVNNYYDWSNALQQLDIVQNKRDLIKRQYNVLESQYKQGMKTKRDVLRIETELPRNELDVLNAQNAVDNSYELLAASVGLSRPDLDREEIIAEEPKPYVTSEGKIEELSADKHRQAKVVAFKNKEAGYTTQLAKLLYWPQVLVTAETGLHDNNYVDYPPADFYTNRYYDWSALVTFKYNLWDWGNLRRSVQVAHLNEVNVIDTGAQSLLDLSTTLRNVMLQLRTFKENVKVTRELLVLEQQSYALLEAEYRTGKAGYLDLINELNNLIDARSKFTASYFSLKKQYALYYFHHGDLYENVKQK